MNWREFTDLKVKKTKNILDVAEANA